MKAVEALDMGVKYLVANRQEIKQPLSEHDLLSRINQAREDLADVVSLDCDKMLRMAETRRKAAILTALALRFLCDNVPVEPDNGRGR